MMYENMTKDELEQEQINLENEYKKILDALEKIELEEIDISRKMTELQLQKRNLSSALLKGRHSLRSIASDMRIIKTHIYRRLRGE